MQDKLLVLGVRVLVNVVYAAGVEGGRPALDSMYHIPLLEKEIRQV